MPLDKEVLILYAVNNGDLDDIPINQCQEFEEGFLRYMETAHPEVGRSILDSRDLTDDNEETLKKAIQDFKLTFLAGR